MRRLLNTICLILFMVILLPQVVYAAYSYYVPITIYNNSSTSYTYLPVLINMNSTQLASFGYINSSGLDANVQEGSSDRSAMIGNGTLGVVLPTLSALQSRPINYQLGYSPAKESFPVVVGYNGNVTFSDSSGLEPGSNMTIETQGLFDLSSSGNSSASVRKYGAYNLYAPNSTYLSSSFMALNSTLQTTVGTWVSMYTGSTIRAGQRFDNFSPTVVTNVTVILNRSGSPTGTLWVRVRSVTDDSILGELGSMSIESIPGSPTWLSFTNPVLITSTQNVRFSIEVSGGDAGNFIQAGRFGANVVEGYLSTYLGSWSDDAASELSFILSKSTQSSPAVSIPITSGSHNVITRFVPGVPVWATGSTLQFIRDSNSYANMGAIYNSQASFWLSFWFKLDTTYDAATGAYWMLWSKQNSTSDLERVMLYSGTGKLLYRHRVGDVNVIDSETTQSSWIAGTWYHVLISHSATVGHRFKVNDTLIGSNGNLSAGPPGGNFLLGDSVIGDGQGFPGVVQNVVVGTDDLTPTEETALYNGIVPADATDYWYIDEGSGDTITSYGSVSNNGTKGSATTWTTSSFTSGNTGRLTDFTLQVDSGRYGINAKGASIPNTDYNWIAMQGNLMPSIDYLKISNSGGQKLWYQPTTIVTSANLPDRSGNGNTGTVNFGANPSGIEITIGAVTPLASFVPPGASSGEVPSVIPSAPDVPLREHPGATGAGLPLYESFVRAAAALDWSVPTTYVVAMMFTAIALGIAAMIGLGTIWGFIIGFGATSAVAGGVVDSGGFHIFPWWLSVLCVMFAVFLGYAWRHG